MKLDLERVKEAFSLYSGESLTAGDSRAALCLRLCGECAETAERLAVPEKEGAAESAGPLENWAAAEAFYQLTLRDRAVSPEIVTADGVRVDTKERAEHAEALAKVKRRAAGHLLREEGFCFERV